MSQDLFQIIFLGAIQTPMALAVFGWGRKYDKRYILSTLACLIPGLGMFYFYWYAYKTISYLLDQRIQ